MTAGELVALIEDCRLLWSQSANEIAGLLTRGLDGEAIGAVANRIRRDEKLSYCEKEVDRPHRELEGRIPPELCSDIALFARRLSRLPSEWHRIHGFDRIAEAQWFREMARHFRVPAEAREARIREARDWPTVVALRGLGGSATLKQIHDRVARNGENRSEKKDRSELQAAVELGLVVRPPKYSTRGKPWKLTDFGR